MQQTEKIIQSLHSITKWGKVGSIFLYISGGLSILSGFWLVLPAAIGVFLIMMGIHVQKSVKAAEQLIQASDTSYEELLEQYAKMMKMQTLFAISSIAAVILSFIAIVLMFILGGLAFLQELPTDVQQYEDYYEEELGDFY
ncbi:DUF5362 family protein [Bacillus sp. FSL R5-0820]|uniref:DUF5362 family protein n=1 Tax=Bacillus sp. BS1807G30 TaxID=3153756 RepID=A0AAU7FID8_9BACI|nr:DUF5362 family protein [Bacillus altitudinis]ANT58238.1 hypothetical protein VP59_15920 [Bacillus pumilus]KSU74392.1 hypothetical protein AS035_01595 [Bacillus altitudinis]MCY7581932.1 DUF5362 family protein [Bacillus altitudinis]MCY7596314.1 DUF5362 family protein [Bacillus altitudinis]NOL34373.1 hypothetical protein [Bacillus altitudinis]